MTASPRPHDEVFGAFRLDRAGVLPCLRAQPLEREGVPHAFTTRLGGVSCGRYAHANLGLSVGDDPTAVRENRTRAAALVGLTPDRLATARQVHGIAALVVDGWSAYHLDGEQDRPLGEADILIAHEAGVALLVQAADCAPILLFDCRRRAIAAVHAGWRGVAAGIGSETVAVLRRVYGSDPLDLIACIGPAIGSCCYEVGEEVARAIAAAGGPGVIEQRAGRLYAGIAAALARQLVVAGVPSGSIAVAPLCTACRTDLFYSHRAEGEPTGRCGAVIALPQTG